MKQLSYTFILLLILGTIEAPPKAQNRRRRSRPQPLMIKTSGVQDVDIGTLEERNKIIGECELPDRPKPEGEIKVASQLCGKALSLVRPLYPEEAKATRVFGPVEVDIVIDEKGRVIWSQAVSGQSLLRVSARKAACRARYSPTLISGRAVKTGNRITYNFVLPPEARR
jgi:TonB family protein